MCAQFTRDALVWGVLGWGEPEKARPIWRDLIDCLEMKLHVDAIIAEGDTVAVRFTERGRAARPFRGFPATGKTYEVVAMEWFVFERGRIHRRWGARDFASMAKQLGWPPG